MKSESKLITPSMEFEIEFKDLVRQIACFMDKSQKKGFKLNIDARLDLDYKKLSGELYKPLVDLENTDFFEKKEVSDGSV